MIGQYFESAPVDEFKEAFLHYPELQGVQIHFRRKPLGTIMAARPTLISVFRKASRRKYLILLNPKFGTKECFFCKLDFQARVGILGHELAHISSYNSMSSLELIMYGIRYLIDRKNIEHHTDEMTVSHGLGMELYHYARIAFNPTMVGWTYFRYKMRNYLNPRRILAMSVQYIHTREE